MEADFFDCPNGEKSVKINGIALHSAYNPSREADRFVSSIQCDFSPSHIIVTEPGLSYITTSLRKKFPSAKLITIRYCNFFSFQDSLWDYVIDIKKGNLSERLFSILGEIHTGTSLYLSWTSSEKIFKEESSFVWNEIKKTIKKGNDILATRKFFSLRWIKNAINFFYKSKKITTPLKFKKDIFIASSGPSLESSYEIIKNNRDSLFLIALSSALLPLTENKIKPDLILSTDGGWWAKKHLEKNYEKTKDVPVAASVESALPSVMLENSPIVPLSYGDGIENTIFSSMGINEKNLTKAKRNGTVSGTAVELALSLTQGKVFIAGLELFKSRGISHARPNAIEEINCQNDMALKNLQTRICPQTFFSPSAQIYRDWFSSVSFPSRLVRIIDKKNYSPKIGNIKDIDIEDFSLFHDKKNTEKIFFSETISLGKNKIKGEKLIEKIFSRPDFIKEFLCQDQMLLEKYKDSEKEKEINDIVEKDINDFKEKIKTFIRRNEKCITFQQ